MARTRTLVQLRDEVRQRADIEGDPHITDAEITRFINQSCAALHARLVDMDEGYFLVFGTFTTIPATPLLQIASTSQAFYKLIHVETTVNGWVRSLARWTLEQHTLLLNASTWGTAQQPITYRLICDEDGTTKLWFSPTPDSAYPISIVAVSAFTDLVNDSDPYNGHDGWEEWVVLDAAIKCLLKMEENPADMRAEREAVMARIESQMRTPDLDHPSAVRDTERAGFGYLPLQVRS